MRHSSKMLVWSALVGVALLFSSCGAGESDLPPPVTNPTGAASRQFLEECTQHADCASGLCQSYPAKGKSLCTLQCSATAPCPSPSPGCNNQGVCKAP